MLDVAKLGYCVIVLKMLKLLMQVKCKSHRIVTSQTAAILEGKY